MGTTAKKAQGEPPEYGAREREGHGRLGQGQVARGQCQKQGRGQDRTRMCLRAEEG